MFSEQQLLILLKVQSNLSPRDFETLFGERGRDMFQLFAKNSWNLVSFIFNQISVEERAKVLSYVNEKAKQL